MLSKLVGESKLLLQFRLKQWKLRLHSQNFCLNPCARCRVLKSREEYPWSRERVLQKHTASLGGRSCPARRGGWAWSGASLAWSGASLAWSGAPLAWSGASLASAGAAAWSGRVAGGAQEWWGAGCCPTSAAPRKCLSQALWVTSPVGQSCCW